MTKLEDQRCDLMDQWMDARAIPIRCTKVALVIFCKADLQTNRLEMTNAEMGKLCGCSSRTVSRHLGDLERLGVIQVTPNRGTQRTIQLVTLVSPVLVTPVSKTSDTSVTPS